MNVLYKVVFKRVGEKEKHMLLRISPIVRKSDYKRIDFLQLCATVKIIKSFVLSLKSLRQ